MDKGWRNNVLKLIAEKSPDTILDIATGTADMAILLSKINAKYILAVDISQGMLAIANEKIQRLNLQGKFTPKSKTRKIWLYRIISLTWQP